MFYTKRMLYRHFSSDDERAWSLKESRWNRVKPFLLYTSFAAGIFLAVFYLLINS